jgi:protein-S-isoprenylcysteine O-methyltransferase Ste14
MNSLTKKALLGFVRFEIIFALLLFLPAWSLRFWQAWIYWGLFSVCVLFITLYFLKYDPSLIERRLKVGPSAEQQTSQKIIQAIAGLLFCTLLIIPGIDFRLHWSAVPMPIVLTADMLVALSLCVVFFVFRENSHTGATVKVEVGQTVVSTGPYRFVRHPMYAGGLLGFFATPLALGSLWALAAAVPLCCAMVVRLLNEEQYLSEYLPGYSAYRRKVRSRLIPLVW